MNNIWLQLIEPFPSDDPYVRPSPSFGTSSRPCPSSNYNSDHFNLADHYADRVFDFSPYNFHQHFPNDTYLSIQHMRELYFSEEFADDEPESIYHYLLHLPPQPAFSDYLKRFIYSRKMLTKDFSLIPDSFYEKILLQSFRNRHVPMSIHKTSTRAPIMVKGWLSHRTIARSSVFLLALALEMSADDLSFFLTYILHESDINYKNPWEVIFWYALQNGLDYSQIQILFNFYERSDSGKSPLSISNRTEDLRAYALGADQTSLCSYLSHLKASGIPLFSRTAREEAIYLLDQLMAAYGCQSDTALERKLYSGIPLDRNSNLASGKNSSLGHILVSKRLNRQHIAAIRKGKTVLSSTDLLTLFFHHFCLKNKNKPLSHSKYKCFIEQINTLLARCNLGQMTATDPYHCFIILCLLSSDPLDTYHSVFELSFEDADI